MNMAERYRQQIEKTKINKQSKTGASVNDFSENVIDINKFKKIEFDTITKIKQTPYWKDYTSASKENMISKYFDSKTKREGTDYTGEEKQSFIRNILKKISG